MHAYKDPAEAYEQNEQGKQRRRYVGRPPAPAASAHQEYDHPVADDSVHGMAAGEGKAALCDQPQRLVRTLSGETGFQTFIENQHHRSGYRRRDADSQPAPGDQYQYRDDRHNSRRISHICNGDQHRLSETGPQTVNRIIHGMVEGRGIPGGHLQRDHAETKCSQRRKDKPSPYMIII